MTHNEYNGWYNYETWLVNLWLSNHEATWDHWRNEQVKKAQEMAKQDPSEYLTFAELARVKLQDLLKEDLENSAADTASESLMAELLRSAVQEVHLGEVVDSLLADNELVAC